MKLRLYNNRGFTLLEILTVLALTIIIMGLVFGPVVQSFNLTRQAEIMVRAQDDARLALSLISRDLANAMYVYDNTKLPMDFPVVDENGGAITVEVPYARVDLVLPRMRAYCTSPKHLSTAPREYPRHYIDPSTGEENVLLDEAAPTCPVDGSPLELRPVEPLTPDTKIVRYFIGLEDPTRPYSNGYMHKLTAAAEDNMYVLYRAEFNPSDDKNDKNRLFPSGRDPMENINDGGFFYNQNANGFGETYAEAWKKISQPIVTLEGTDLVRIRYVANLGVVDTIVIPTVRFEPTPIYSDQLVPTSESGDDPEHGDTPPTMYKATYGHWVLPYQITIEPDKEVMGADDYFFKAVPGLGEGMGPLDDMCVYRVQQNDPALPHIFVFDITHYEETKAVSRYGAGDIRPSSLDDRPQRAFTVDTVRGTVDFSFPVVSASVVGNLKVTVGKVAGTNDINGTFNIADPYRYLRINDILVAGEQILRNSTVVPGSVRVIGPDMTPGNATAELVLYTRLPFLLYDPRENQYTVDPYFDETSGTAEIRFCSLQTAAGNPGPPLPPDREVLVYYEVQNNKKGDVLRANYVTKSLMTVIMGIRIYNSGSGRPEAVELTNKIRLRNIRT